MIHYFLLNVSGHADTAAPAWKEESGCYGAADVAAAVANARFSRADSEKEGASLGRVGVGG